MDNGSVERAAPVTGESGGGKTKTWLITGASRGFGREFARVAWEDLAVRAYGAPQNEASHPVGRRSR